MSRRLRLVNGLLRLVAKPWMRRVRSPRAVRAVFAVAALGLLPPWGTRVRRAAGGAVITCGPARGDAALLYLHGGGYIAGSPRTHRALLGRLARRTGLAVTAPDYRLAPEFPLPAALEDALAAWARLVAGGTRPDRIVLAGDSAGGGLALALLAVLCARGTPPAALAVFSPWTDLTGSGASLSVNAAADPLFPPERIPDLVGFCLGAVPAADPRISPLFADFPGAPPCLIQVGSTEILRDDSARMAARLEGFGAAVALEVWPDCPHVWQMLGVLPEAEAALERVAAFLDVHLPTSWESPAGN